MIDRVKPKMNRGKSGGTRLVVSGILAMGLFGQPRVRAQAPPDENPTFEVAAIKPQAGYPNGYHHPVFLNGRLQPRRPQCN
jgi:hypothetical protein